MDIFDWNCLPASGHSGGILVGTKWDLFVFVAFDHGIFWASTVVHHRQLNTLSEIMVVYGPADHSMTSLILDKISTKIEACTLPIMVGSDFNVLRTASDKTNYNFSWPLADAFNGFIRDCALCELPRVGAWFTWTKHQANQVRLVLDRVFICSN